MCCNSRHCCVPFCKQFTNTTSWHPPALTWITTCALIAAVPKIPKNFRGQDTSNNCESPLNEKNGRKRMQIEGKYLHQCDNMRSLPTFLLAMPASLSLCDHHKWSLSSFMSLRGTVCLLTTIFCDMLWPKVCLLCAGTVAVNTVASGRVWDHSYSKHLQKSYQR